MSEVLENWINQGQTVIKNGLLKYYRSIGLNNEELLFAIQLQSYLDQNIFFPNMAEIAARMGKEEAEVFSILHRLIQNNTILIETEKDNNGKDEDRYSLYPLYVKLARYLNQQTEAAEANASDINLLEIFQQEFGRLLTPIEMQTIGDWLDRDRYSKELIMEALREAVLNQKYSLKYMDRILLSWEKKNIRTPVQAKEETKKFTNHYQKNTTTEEPEDSERIPLFNWLDKNE